MPAELNTSGVSDAAQLAFDNTAGAGASDDVATLAADADIDAAFNRAQEAGDASTGDALLADEAAGQGAGDAAALERTETVAPTGATAASGAAATPADSTQNNDPPAPWYSDADLRDAQARGLSAYDLNAFESAKDYQKAIWAADRIAARTKPADSAQTTAATTETAAAAPVDESTIDAPTLPDGRINVSYFEKRGYDDDQIAAYKSMRATQDRDLEFRQQLEQREAAREQEAQDAELQHQMSLYHTALDNARPDFYGKAVDEHGNVNRFTPEEQARRDALLEEIEWKATRIAQTQARAGQPIAMPGWDWFIKECEPLVHGKTLAELEARKQQRRQVDDVRNQSREIQPSASSSGAARARRVVTNRVDDAHVLAADPDIDAAWKRAQA